MSKVSSLKIPAQNLRRSCRRAIVKDTNCVIDNVKRNSDRTLDTHYSKKKKIKIETDLVDEKPNYKQAPDTASPIEHDNKTIQGLIGTKITVQTPLADGYLNVEAKQLDLERTLMGGQSFRWHKISGESANIFQGVLKDYALQLWRTSDSRIAFRVLNRHSSHNGSTLTHLLQDYFQLKYNLVDLYKEWSLKDPNLAKCCKQYEGFRILRQDPVENLFSFICATNNNIKRISQMIENLCMRFGTILDVCSDEKSNIYSSYRSFPSVERLADEEVFNCLRYELKFGYRAKYITESAKQIMTISQKEGFEDPRDYLLSLRQLPYEETRKQLMTLQGIGRKVADCICLMSMDHLDSVPVDCHIYEIVCRNYMPGLKSEHKSLSDKVHNMVRDYFSNLHGPLAGWSTSVLFIAELKHLKTESSKK